MFVELSCNSTYIKFMVSKYTSFKRSGFCLSIDIILTSLACICHLNSRAHWPNAVLHEGHSLHRIRHY